MGTVIRYIRTRCSRELGERVAKRIREGSSIYGACIAESIPPSTHQKWMKKGEEGHEDYFPYLQEVVAALEEWAQSQYATRDQHARWLVEKRYKRVYHEPKKAEPEKKPEDEESQPSTEDAKRWASDFTRISGAGNESDDKGPN